MIIRIKNLRLRTIIGVNAWEREKQQDIILNIKLEYNGDRASVSDNIEDTLNYKTITKRVIAVVESSKYYLLEKLAQKILTAILEDSKVESATVEIDKPQALRYSDSVSVTRTAIRSHE